MHVEFYINILLCLCFNVYVRKNTKKKIVILTHTQYTHSLTLQNVFHEHIHRPHTLSTHTHIQGTFNTFIRLCCFTPHLAFVVAVSK